MLFNKVVFRFLCFLEAFKQEFSSPTWSQLWELTVLLRAFQSPPETSKDGDETTCVGSLLHGLTVLIAP